MEGISLKNGIFEETAEVRKYESRLNWLRMGSLPIGDFVGCSLRAKVNEHD
jgi:hypothetical protein